MFDRDYVTSISKIMLKERTKKKKSVSINPGFAKTERREMVILHRKCLAREQGRVIDKTFFFKL